MPARSGLTYQIDEGDDSPTLRLSGVIDERADLTVIDQHIVGPTNIHTAGVKRITSTGAKLWLQFVRGISDRGPHRLESCSPCFVGMLNLLPGFEGEATIASVLVPYVCPVCEASQMELLELGTQVELPPPMRCAECDVEFELDHVETRYLAFLRHL